MGSTYGLVVLGWIFFRSPSVTDASYYILKIFTQFTIEVPNFSDIPRGGITLLLIVLLIAIGVGWKIFRVPTCCGWKS